MSFRWGFGRWVRPAASAVAGLALLIQLLAIGSGAMPAAAPREGQHAHASQRDHHSAPPDAPDHRAAHCGWCPLCGKLGIAVGEPERAVTVGAPSTSYVAIRAIHPGAAPASSLPRLLPVGARAPPELA